MGTERRLTIGIEMDISIIASSMSERTLEDVSSMPAIAWHFTASSEDLSQA